MEPKICPECGANNEHDALQCHACNLPLPKPAEIGTMSGPASILNVKQPPAVPQPATPPQEQPQYDVVSKGPFGPNPSAQQAPSMYSSTAYSNKPPSPSQAPPRFEKPVRYDEGVNWRMIAILVLLLTLLTGVAWVAFLRPATPADTISRLVGACESGDIEAAKSCFTNASLTLLGVPAGSSGVAGGFVQARGRVNIRAVGTVYEGEQQQVAVVECEPADSPQGIRIRFDLVLIQEEGDWKIDVPRTLHRARQQGGCVRVSGG